MTVWDRERKTHLLLGISFFVVGVLVSYQLITLTQEDMDQDDKLQAQITCNSKLTDTLRTRSNARLNVDVTTRSAQSALISVLEDLLETKGPLPLNDPHVTEAIRRFQLSVDARNNPDLSIPYADCTGREIE
jgi:hypothetical protein